MKDKIFLSLIIFIYLMTCGFSNKQHKSEKKETLVYAIVYTEECKNTSAYKYYTYLVPESDVYQFEQNLKKKLKSDFPNAKEIKVNNSKFAYGPSARYVCILQWERKSGNCSYKVVHFSFGKTQEEACSRGEKVKNEYAGKDTPFTVLEQNEFSQLHVNSTTNEINNASTNPNSETVNIQVFENSHACSPQGLSLKGSPGASCAEFIWLSQEINSVSSNDEVTQRGNYPDKFILQYKRSSDLIWRELKLDGYALSYSISSLEPCTNYDVRLQRDCGDNRFSEFSKTINFTTSCPYPTATEVYNVTSNSAHIKARTSYSSHCSNENLDPTKIIEYKTTAMEDWLSIVCLPNQDCPLTNLKPSTTYLARVKFQYGDKLSDATKIINFSTLP